MIWLKRIGVFLAVMVPVIFVCPRLHTVEILGLLGLLVPTLAVVSAVGSPAHPVVTRGQDVFWTYGSLGLLISFDVLVAASQFWPSAFVLIAAVVTVPLVAVFGIVFMYSRSDEEQGRQSP